MEPRVSLLLRDTNDTSRNAKVGSLYQAYNEVVDYALGHGYDFLHILQHDMQLLWWGEIVLRRAAEIYAEYPECVNISTLMQTQYVSTAAELEYVKPKLVRLPYYGLTDTGLYHLGRWREREMRFMDSESAHARTYYGEGLRVLLHPLPVIAPIPWPAVVRGGKVKGREVRTREQFLLRPLSTDQVTAVVESIEPVWLDQLCVPWGWTCLAPYWVTDLSTIGYWVYLYRTIRSRGLAAGWPRWERGGLAAGESAYRVQRRPRFGLWSVAVQPGWHALRRAVRRAR